MSDIPVPVFDDVCLYLEPGPPDLSEPACQLHVRRSYGDHFSGNTRPA